MKKDTHPKYQKVLYVDTSTGEKRLIGTTMNPKGKEEFEGQEYPAYHTAVSSYSHPLYTGQSRLADTEGRVQRFTKRYENKQAHLKQQIEEKKVIETKKPAKKGKK